MLIFAEQSGLASLHPAAQVAVIVMVGLVIIVLLSVLREKM